jgi:hypothetical protein
LHTEKDGTILENMRQGYAMFWGQSRDTRVLLGGWAPDAGTWLTQAYKQNLTSALRGHGWEEICPNEDEAASCAERVNDQN